MKRNPFDKFIKGETAIHIQVAEYLQYQYPNVMFHHSPNEARRTPFERYLISKMGVSAGFPDFVIYGDIKTLYLELKYGNNTPTEDQKKWLNYLGKDNYTFVAWSFESAKEIIDFTLSSKIAYEFNIRFNGHYFVDMADMIPAKIKKQLDL